MTYSNIQALNTQSGTINNNKITTPDEFEV